MATLISGFLHTDVMNFVDCPECSQPAGTCCTNHKAKKQSAPHKSRADAYSKKFPDRKALYEGAHAERLDLILQYNQKLVKTKR